jgi:glycosyltransferase involved in cell wall biosynthesis
MVGKYEENFQLMPTLLFFITEDWVFCSHRLPLAVAAVKAGFDVTIITNVNSHGEKIRSSGIRLIPLPLRRSSMNPLRELKTLWQVICIYRSVQPDIVHHVAIKPVLYGSIAALAAGKPRVVNALTGMGYLFISNTLKAKLVRGFIKIVFSILLNIGRTRLIMQNSDDIKMLVEQGITDESRVRLIRGAGVSVTIFVPTPEPPIPITIILPARMLLDKGVVEFVNAARILKMQGCLARFVLVGGQDPENPANISDMQLGMWQQEGVIEWWGFQADMVSVFSKAHIVCLPSYREGLPKALLEAAACGKPIVATDVPGCREIVRAGVNGFLVPARDSDTLAEALRNLIDNKVLREQMGSNGREMVLNEFSEEKIIAETMLVYRELLTL